MESSSGWSVRFGHRHRDHPEDPSGGLSEKSEDFYPAIREDIQLATREDFYMAMDTTDYAFSFDPELEEEWTWSEKYAT